VVTWLPTRACLPHINVFIEGIVLLGSFYADVWRVHVVLKAFRRPRHSQPCSLRMGTRGEILNVYDILA
jgi:hypothetical protein